MELQALEAARPDFEALGATLIAISPQTAPNSRKSVRQNKLGFPILRSEEHTSELQSLMRISYAVFCLKKKKLKTNTTQTILETHKNDQIYYSTSTNDSTNYKLNTLILL